MSRTPTVPGRPLPAGPRRGRGAASNPDGRFESLAREAVDDGWERDEGEDAPLRTTLTPDASRSVLSFNASPDIPFDRSINPYRGCEHGCVYCYARPSHAYLGLSPGLDFESRLFFKPDAAARLREELARPGYRCAPVVLGANTDPYQPAERRLGVTRAVLEVLAECRHPVQVVTKSKGVERDLDLLGPMGEAGLATVSVSVTTLDRRLSLAMEPRATAPTRRIETLRRVATAGVPAAVFVAPLIPGLNDAEAERILEHARDAGAASARHVLLRLPREVAALFEQWLRAHYPERAERVLSLVRDTRGGRLNDPRFGSRMKGTGPVAALLARRFEVAARRLGFEEPPALDTAAFRPPPRHAGQLRLL